MIFWFVLKLEMSYRSYNNILKDFLFLLEDFLKIIFLHGERFEFPQFFFCLKILFNIIGKGNSVMHPLFLLILVSQTLSLTPMCNAMFVVLFHILK
jgi:hypothetical protein